MLSTKHARSDSTNALSPLGQEAIDILDELYNTLDDQSRLDQAPSSEVQSSQSLEMINGDWVNVSASSLKPANTTSFTSMHTAISNFYCLNLVKLNIFNFR